MEWRCLDSHHVPAMAPILEAAHPSSKSYCSRRESDSVGTTPDLSMSTSDSVAMGRKRVARTVTLASVGRLRRCWPAIYAHAVRISKMQDRAVSRR